MPGSTAPCLPAARTSGCATWRWGCAMRPSCTGDGRGRSATTNTAMSAASIGRWSMPRCARDATEAVRLLHEHLRRTTRALGARRTCYEYRVNAYPTNVPTHHQQGGTHGRADLAGAADLQPSAHLGARWWRSCRRNLGGLWQRQQEQLDDCGGGRHNTSDTDHSGIHGQHCGANWRHDSTRLVSARGRGTATPPSSAVGAAMARSRSASPLPYGRTRRLR